MRKLTSDNESLHADRFAACELVVKYQAKRRVRSGQWPNNSLRRAADLLQAEASNAGGGISLSDPDAPDHAHLPGCGFRPDCVRLP